MIAYFGTRSWDFKNNNVQTLWRSLDPKDKELFFFDISQLDWDKYFYSYIRGVRQYLVKEDPSTIPQGLKKLRRYVVLMFTVRKYIQRFLIAQSSVMCILAHVFREIQNKNPAKRIFCWADQVFLFFAKRIK